MRQKAGENEGKGNKGGEGRERERERERQENILASIWHWVWENILENILENCTTMTQLLTQMNIHQFSDYISEHLHSSKLRVPPTGLVQYCWCCILPTIQFLPYYRHLHPGIFP